MSSVHLDPAIDMLWAQKGQVIAMAVLEAVEAEVIATDKQLVKLQTMADLVSCRLDQLREQVNVAHQNKVIMDKMYEVVTSQSRSP